MERLTFDGNFCDIAQCREMPCPYNNACTQRQVWERLKQYEDSGLSPIACEEARKIEDGLSKHDYSIARMVELMQADKDGRLMALLKVARIAGNRPKPDNWVDLAGYAACGAEISAREPKRTTKRTASTSDAAGGAEAGKTASCVKLQRMDGYYLVDVDGNSHRFTLWETAMQFIRDQTAEERKKKT